MLSLSKKDFADKCGTYNRIPVFVELRADTETPVSIFLKSSADYLLESVEKGNQVGRYTIIGKGKKTEFVIRGRSVYRSEYIRGEKKSEAVGEDCSPLQYIKDYMSGIRIPDCPELGPFPGGLIGYLGYETVRLFEKIPVNEKGSKAPDGILIVPDILIVMDNVKRNMKIIVIAEAEEDRKSPEELYEEVRVKIENEAALLFSPLIDPGRPVKAGKGKFRSLTEKNDFTDSVKKCREYIKSGDIIQGVISQKFQTETETAPFDIYRNLRIVNPSPYMFFLDFEDFKIIGSSPEVMVRVKERKLLLKPIAGTRKRGRDLKEDLENEKELLSDEKERAEHLMLVDLGRNDLGRVAVPGSVRVSEYAMVERYSHVMHIVSSIKADLIEGKDAFDVIPAVFPAGTLTGAPKIRAMEIITELESLKRGPYGGMIVYLGYNGNLDSCITIRTMVMEGKTVTVQAGAGIVYDSVPENEYAETVNKASALFRAVGGEL
ncbi:MAG: anthranilate synthase component I [Fibrobacterota bacterium]